MNKTKQTETIKSLTRLLREIPDSIFFDDSGKIQFNRIFAAVLEHRGLVDAGGDMRAVALWGEDAPNLSSFQRSVAKEAASRKQRLGVETTRKGPTKAAKPLTAPVTKALPIETPPVKPTPSAPEAAPEGDGGGDETSSDEEGE